ncbi:unnamed protein product [Microthlaspi erraticum]|uniref:RPW8 domain-containing protein n=1 Tax=Microthlaspi erraticum TaxID=1685480 RepID=A0A6D2KJ57_9BRAS|nr:unnamed protein product [Microthlaspi erraticum]
MTDWVDLGVSSVAGALVSGALKLVIAEAIKHKDFKPLSVDLVSTMTKLLPLTQDIDSKQNELDLGAGELKELRDTIEKARVLVLKFPNVGYLKRSRYTRKIEGINKELLNFCSIDLQLLQYSNSQIQLGLTGNILEKLDGLSKRMEGLRVPLPFSKGLCSVPKSDKALFGLDWPLIELKKRLLDNAVVNLVVSAPPGCGKTTLVTQLCHNEDIKGKFKHIFFNVVSNTPNFRVLVQNLLQHNGYQALTFANDPQAVVALRTLLEGLKGPILLVLDDVWPGAESMLLKFRMDLPDYKILVTSRSEFPSFGSNYVLKPLKDEDARALLIQWASRPYNASPAEYEDLLQKILKRCNGFPIVIEVVGISLNGRSLRTWKGKVESWSEGETVLDKPQPTVLQCLQPSFNALEPNLKECFLDMGSFLEDQKILASVIIDMWMELYGRSSSNLCMKYLEDLASQNLLKLVPLGNEQEDGFYNEFLVTQHDILRELAIHQSEPEAILERKRLNLEIKEDNFPEWCLDLNQPIKARLLSISTDDLFSSNWVELDCPNVEALILNIISSSSYALPSFIAGMKKLKVLTITSHGFYPARLSNFSVLSSLPNLKRIRLENASITLLDIHQLQLISLKKLSLVGCSFGEVFYDVEDDTDVSTTALSSLQEIEIDYCYDLDELPYWISEAVSLKTLSITNCNKLSKLPESIGNLGKLETLRLSSCISLSELPETTERLCNLRFLDISHCLGLRKLPLEIGKLQKLKKISMSKCGKCELPDSVRNLENLEVKCDEETGLLWERLKPKMRNLKVNEVETQHNLNILHMR